MIWAGKIGKKHKKRTFFQFFLLSPLDNRSKLLYNLPQRRFRIYGIVGHWGRKKVVLKIRKSLIKAFYTKKKAT